MSIDSQTELRDNYVLFSCYGTFSNDALLNVYEAALDFAENKGLKAILVDISDLDGALPTTMERYNHGVTVARMQLKHDKRIFIAVVGKEPIIDPQRFGEIVAVNRGAYCKVFIDIDDAITWLEREVIKQNFVLISR